MMYPEKVSFSEDVQKFMDDLAIAVVKLFCEQPTEITKFENGKENSLGVSYEVYTAAVPLKNAFSSLFTTMANSLSSLGPVSKLLLHENGDIDPSIMKAISFRYVADMNFPEFSVPLGRELKKTLQTNALTTMLWRLEEGEKGEVYFQSTPKDPPPRTKPLPRRAIPIRLIG